MAFSAADLASIELAIIEIATGSKAVRVTLASGHTIQYSEQDIGKLQTLRSIIQAEIGTTVPRAYAKNGGRGR